MTPHGHSRCRDLLERLSAYIDGELSPAAARKVEEHLHQCVCCDEFMMSLRRTVALCKQSGRRRLPPPVRARARARIAELLAQEAPASVRRS